MTASIAAMHAPGSGQSWRALRRLVTGGFGLTTTLAIRDQRAYRRHMAADTWMRWLGKIAGWSLSLFLRVGLPLWVDLDGLGAGCVNDPGGGDPHCHQAIAPHDWVAVVFIGGIWWIGAVAAVVGWTLRKVRRSGSEDEARRPER
jgi:hypothetical protein